jgi:hypothetical protein
MKTKIYLMIALALLLVLPMVYADCDTSYGTFKQNTAVSLIQTCTTCSDINASITLPDSSSTGLIQFQLINGIYNYTFSNTNQLGIYNVIGTDAWCYSFEVTPSGTLPLDSIPLEIILSLFGYLSIIVYSFNKKLSLLKNVGCMLLMVIGTMVLVNGINGLSYLLNLSLGIINIGVGFFYMLKGYFEGDENEDKDREFEEVED